MNKTTLPEEAVKAGTLWAVNIHGPDDLIAAPDYMSAVRMANAFNAWWLNLKMKQPHNDAIDARMWAAPTDWPGNDAQGHADELSKPHPEYQWLRDASAAPPLASVRVKSELDIAIETAKRGEFKALYWYDVQAVCSWCYAKSAVGEYSIDWTCNIHGQRLTYPDGKTAKFYTRDEAKAAAQADYEARILSALEPSAGRAAVLEEAARVAGNFLMLKTGLPVDKIVELEAALRALSSPGHADAGKVEGGWKPGCDRLPTLQEAAFAAKVLDACNGYDLSVWTDDLWPCDYASEGLRAIIAHSALPTPPSSEVA